jgi:hypothetical protein
MTLLERISAIASGLAQGVTLELTLARQTGPGATGLGRTLRGSGGEKDAATKEIEVGSAVYLPLHHLELGDLTFGLSIAPSNVRAARTAALS